MNYGRLVPFLISYRERSELLIACKKGLLFAGGGSIWRSRRVGNCGSWGLKWRAAQEPPNFLAKLGKSRNGRARKLSPNPRALPCLPANYLIEASKVCFEAGAFWARNSASARLSDSLYESLLPSTLISDRKYWLP